MKIIFIPALLVMLSLYATAQNEEETEKTKEAKNIIKLNLPALVLKNISVQYERAIAKKITLAGTFRYMPDGDIPLKSTFIKLADDPDVERQINNLSVGNTAFMPEIRFYLGKKGAFRGFYIAPYATIAKFNADLVFEYDDAGSTKTIPLSGSLSSLTGGLMFGAQWKLSKLVYLDWWIVGANYGNSKGDISGKKSLSSTEQQSLRDELDALDIPLTKFTYNVDANGATINFKGPWGGMRSGICIGFRF